MHARGCAGGARDAPYAAVQDSLDVGTGCFWHASTGYRAVREGCRSAEHHQRAAGSLTAGRLVAMSAWDVVGLGDVFSVILSRVEDWTKATAPNESGWWVFAFPPDSVWLGC